MSTGAPDMEMFEVKTLEYDARVVITFGDSISIMLVADPILGAGHLLEEKLR